MGHRHSTEGQPRKAAIGLLNGVHGRKTRRVDRQSKTVRRTSSVTSAHRLSRRVNEHVHLLADEDRQVAPRETEDHLQNACVNALGAVAGE